MLQLGRHCKYTHELLYQWFIILLVFPPDNNIQEFKISNSEVRKEIVKTMYTYTGMQKWEGLICEHGLILFCGNVLINNVISP